MSFGAELPFGRTSGSSADAGTLATRCGGWQAQSIVNYRSGLPFTPTVGRDVANTGSGGQRPERWDRASSRIPRLISGPTKRRSWCLPDFTLHGDTERGILRGDHQWNVDFSLFKRFRVQRLEVARVPG